MRIMVCGQKQAWSFTTSRNRKVYESCCQRRQHCSDGCCIYVGSGVPDTDQQGNTRARGVQPKSSNNSANRREYWTRSPFDVWNAASCSANYHVECATANHQRLAI